MASSSLNENQHLVSSSPDDNLEGMVAADTYEGSSSESGDTKCVNEAHSRKEITKQKIAIPNPAPSAAVDSKAAIPKRPREEKVDVNRSGNRSVVVEVSSKRKKRKVAKSTTTSPVVADVNKPNNKSSSAGITWTDKDEIVILGDLISFSGENRQHKPEDFYMYIKDRLGKGDPIQVQKKVKSLRKKYRRMQEQQAQNNQASFANSHDQMVFDLSKIYWDGEDKKNETKSTMVDDAEEMQTLIEKKKVQNHKDQKNKDPKNEDPKNEGHIHKDQKNEGPMNKDQKNEGPMNEGPMNEGPMNEGPMNEVPMNEVPMNEVPMNEDNDTTTTSKATATAGVQEATATAGVQDDINSQIDQVLRDGLKNYFRTEPFDHMWAEAEEIDSLVGDWKEFKIAEAKYKFAKANFDKKAKGIALKAYVDFGYPNDS